MPPTPKIQEVEGRVVYILNIERGDDEMEMEDPEKFNEASRIRLPGEYFLAAVSRTYLNWG